MNKKEYDEKQKQIEPKEDKGRDSSKKDRRDKFHKDKKFDRSDRNREKNDRKPNVGQSLFTAVLPKIADRHVVVPNAVLVTKGTTTSGEREMYGLTGYVTLEYALFSNTAQTLVAGHIQRVIDAVNAARASSGSVTSTVVKDVILASANYLAQLIAYKRYYDGKNARNSKGESIGPLVTTRGYETPAGDNALKAVIENAAANVATESAIENNADWENLYTSAIPFVRMPAAWLPIIVALFSVLYRVNRKSNAVVSFYPAGFNNATAIAATLSASKSTLLGYYTTYPELSNMLDILGFNAVALPLDFSRDNTGRSMNIVDDPAMNDIISNGKLGELSVNSGSDDDVNQLIYIPSTKNGITEIDDQLTVSADALKHLFTLGWFYSLRPAFLVPIIRILAGGAWTSARFHNPVLITTWTSDLSITDTVALGRITAAESLFNLAIGDDATHYTARKSIAIATNVATITDGGITVDARESGSMFHLPDDGVLLRTTQQCDMLWSKSWRVALQGMLETIGQQYLKV